MNGQALDPNDTESYYYLKGYKHKRDVVKEEMKGSRLQYRVYFGKEEDIYVYHEELTL